MRLSDGHWLSLYITRRAAFVLAIANLFVILALFLNAQGTLDQFGRPLGTDFSQVWVAGDMVRDGRAAEVWDWTPHFAAQREFHGKPDVDGYGWHYPPPFLLVAWALALLPYVAALLVWQGVTLGAFGALAAKASGRKDIWLFLLGAPVTLICIGHGHNGFLTAFLLGAGLWLLDRRPLVAGLFLGALVYKPQFAIILPVALLAGRQWRAILGAAISSVGLCLLTLAVWGWPVWQAFIDSLPLTRTIILEAGATGFHKIITPFAMVRMAGGDVAAAYAVQATATAAMIGLVAWLALKARPDVRNAGIALAALIATPYSLDYDLVAMLVAIFFLYRDASTHGWLAWEKIVMALAWITPFFARSLGEATGIPSGQIALFALVALTVRRALVAKAVDAP